MPYYDYKCSECKHKEIDVKQSITDTDNTVECPVCNGIMNRIISGGVSFSLKGGGWYSDGYNKPNTNTNTNN